MRALLSLAVLAASCASARPVAPRTEVLASGHPSGIVSSAPPAGPMWQRVAPREIAFPLFDVAALSHGGAIVATAEGLFRVESSHAQRVCIDESSAAARMLQAVDDRVLALGGTEIEPLVWRSTDRGTHCQRVRVPPLNVTGPRATDSLHLEFDGTTAIVWTRAGALAYSLDAGATWTRGRDLPGAIGIFPGRNGALFAAVRLGTTAAHYGELVRLYRTGHADTEEWSPLVGPETERRMPIRAARASDGSLLLLDALGTVRIDNDGVMQADQPEPALRAREEHIRIAVPAGPDRFVVAAERTFVDVGPGRFEPFAPFEPSSRLAIDANAEGDVWLAHRAGLFHGHIGARHLDPVIVGPQLNGPLAVLATSRDDIALVSHGGDVSLSRDRGERWRTVHLDALVGATDAAFDARGNLLVVGGGTNDDPAVLAVTDGEAVVRLVPRTRSASSGDRALGWSTRPAVHAVGERWIVVDRGVYTSDDEGAHWTSRMPDDSRSAVVSTVFVGASMLALDLEGRVWRSDDACSSVVPASITLPPTTTTNAEVDLPMMLAWNGERSIAIASRARIARSDDGGATWRNTTRGIDVASGFDLCMLADRRMFARNVRGRADEGRLLVEDAASGLLVPIADDELHPAAAIVCDIAANAVYVASPEGSITRLDARQVR